MAEQSCFDLDLLIERFGKSYRARVLQSLAGEGQTVTFKRPFSELELKDFLLKLGQSRVRTRRVDAASVAAAKQFGGRLFSAVFTGPVRECLRRSADRAQSKDAMLRIRLWLSDCPELADMPWEFLYDQDDDWFVALSGATPVVRYVQSPAQPRPVRVTLPLRILVIRSEPADWPKLDLATEWAQVEAALSELTAAGAVTFTDLAVPTLSELRRALLRDQYHVLHYMGHGAFTEQDGGTLLFTDKAGRSVPVTGERLSVMLKDHTSLRLAILNACEAGRTDPAHPFGGLADTLVRRGIPAVIAMQFEVTDMAAIEFAPALYGALAVGRPVDAAVAEARKAIYAVSALEWATPVLYLRADDARLFDISQPAQSSDHVAEGDRQLKDRSYPEAEDGVAAQEDVASAAAASTAQAADVSAWGSRMFSRSDLPMMQKRIFRWATAYYETIVELAKKYPDPEQILPRFLLPHPRQVRLVVAPRAISVISYESAEPWRADWVDDVDFENELPSEARPLDRGLNAGGSHIRMILVQEHYMDETLPDPTPHLWEKLIQSGANAARHWTPDLARAEANNDVLSFTIKRLLDPDSPQNKTEEAGESPQKAVARDINALIGNFEELLADANNEEEIQVFIKDHSAILDLRAIFVDSKVSLGSEYVTDFVVNLPGGQYLLVNLGQASEALYTETHNPTTPMAHAVRQVEDWLEWSYENLSYLRNRYPDIHEPRGLVVIGRRSSLDHKAAKALRRHNAVNKVKVATYDDLIDDMRAVASNLERGGMIPTSPNFVGG